MTLISRAALLITALLLAVPASSQTRLYFPATTAAAITPAADANWNDASEIQRRQLANVKGSSAITAGQTVDILEDQADYQDLDRQYISTRMASGVIFTSASTTVGAVVMMREFGATDDVTQCILGIRVLSEDGGTVRQTLLAVSNIGPTLEMINNATMRNKQCANLGVDTLTASYTTVTGDRLVVEIGYQTDGAETTPQAAGKWGENATDCAENETNTSDCAGWIEFSNTITFIGEAGPPVGGLLLLGVGR